MFTIQWKMSNSYWKVMSAIYSRNSFLTIRIEVLEKMQKRGIPTIVWLTPILPFINDNEDNVTSIMSECARTGVKGVIDFGMGLTLRKGDREYYYAALDKHFPGLKQRYIRTYRNSYELPSPNAKELTAIYKRICKENGIMSTTDECFQYIGEFPEKQSQISIFDLWMIVFILG